MRKITAVAALLLLTALTRTLEERIQRIASEIDSTIGVAALHVESGRRFSVRADEPFPMASVYKLPVAIAFLREVDAGRYSLSSEVTVQPGDFSDGHSPLRERAGGRPLTITLREAVQAMVGQSDNMAADVLIRLTGGGRAVTGVVRDLGISGIDVTADAYAGAAGETATPAAMLAVLERLYSQQAGLSKSSHDLLMRIMSTSSTGEHRIKAGAPDRATVANKTGTLPGTVNDAGIITSPDGRHHVLIVVFTKDGRTSTMTQRERAVSLITRSLYREFVGWTPWRRASRRQ
ncbi:MAG TPA: class A beta-lactamase [Thermoanaerobaculia bacterium]|nr:class A beta-lactamase [Thermoanaerobaculia bacterium]